MLSVFLNRAGRSDRSYGSDRECRELWEMKEQRAKSKDEKSELKGE